jgi:hypothetical protein
MNLSTIKAILLQQETLQFRLENGAKVPDHFHVSEVGVVSKDFIDCGGTVRSLKVANFQLWSDKDYDHRLKASKLLDIIELSEKVLHIDVGLEIEVEYQMDTIGKYGLDFDGTSFVLKLKTTDCLAVEKCALPQQSSVNLSDMLLNNGCSGDGCC